MDALFEAIRAECTRVVWSRAVHLSRRGTVDGKHTHNDELEVRIITQGGMHSPLVVLSAKHQDWSCECPSPEPVCVHVAAAIIAVREALKRGEGIASLEAPSAKIAYRLSRADGALALERFLARGETLTPLETRLTVAKQHDSDGDLAASQADIAVDLALGSTVSGKIPRALMQRVLAALQECTDVHLDGQPVTIADPGPVMCVRVDDHPEGFRLYAEQDPAISEVFSNGAVLHDGVLRAIGDAQLSLNDIEELRRGRIFAFEQVADLAGRVLPTLRERIAVDVRSQVLPKATPMRPRLAFDADYDGECLSVLTTLVYGDPPAARVDAGKLHYLGGPLPLRDPFAEDCLLQELKWELGIELGKTHRFTGVEAIEKALAIRQLGDVVIQGAGLEACFVCEPLQPQFALKGCDFDLTFLSSDGDVTRHATAQAVLSAWNRGDALVPLLEGGWAPIPEALLDRCGQLLADLIAAKAEEDKLPRGSVADLALLCDALEHPRPPDFEKLRVLMGDFAGIPNAALPPDLTATLRGYQVRGVDWLRFLSGADLGGLLADDMGLGKTLQALCAVGFPCLVVAPASVLHNWAKEIQKFRPGLTHHIYHGPGRSLDPDTDVTITTYAILRLDEETLAARQWDSVVLDEAQNIKNAESQAAQAAFGLEARFRLALTGTPVENRLDELWSQFHFINRGLLGGRQDFQDRYARPIGEGDQAAAKRLRQRIRPFVLRRLKREVARELPPRTDVVLRCALDDVEREVYDAIHAATKTEVLEQLKAGGSVMAALEALLRLRQACCHTGLLPGKEADTSSKLSLLMETLENALAAGHKALVFSQWTSLLNLTEPHLDGADIRYCRLDGSTRDRAGVVEAFQDPDGPPVMLVSLRAGGTGLNLTAADNVFLLDLWWNPAVEDQAADRTHRIGQQRPVLVQRLVAENTVEERILELQERKRHLARTALEDGAQAQGLTREDLLVLLS